MRLDSRRPRSTNYWQRENLIRPSWGIWLPAARRGVEQGGGEGGTNSMVLISPSEETDSPEEGVGRERSNTGS